MHLTYRWRATLVIAPGLLMSVLDITIVSVVLPQIATALHADYQTSTWIGTGYLLANAAVIPITGYISDISLATLSSVSRVQPARKTFAPAFAKARATAPPIEPAAL